MSAPVSEPQRARLPHQTPPVLKSVHSPTDSLSNDPLPAPQHESQHTPIHLLPPEEYQQPDPQEFQLIAKGLLQRIGAMICTLENAHQLIEKSHTHTLKEVQNQAMRAMGEQMDYQQKLEEQQEEYSFWDTLKHIAYGLLAACSTIAGAAVLAAATGPVAVIGGLALVGSGLSSMTGTALSVTNTAPEAAMALNIASIPLGLAGGVASLGALPAAAQLAERIGHTTAALASGTADIAQATIPIYETRAKTVAAEGQVTDTRNRREDCFEDIKALRDCFHDIHRQCVIIQHQKEEANRAAAAAA